MKEVKISNEQFEMIQSDSFDSNFWFYQLGLGLSSENVTNENRFSFDFYNNGKEYWGKFSDQLMNLLCDRSNKAPNSMLDEFLNGDIRNLIVYLITIIVTNLDVVLSAAIPIVALILKRGMKDFCSKS